MFAVGSFEEIVRRERQADTKQVVIFLFVRPTGVLNQDIIKDFEYIHYNSAGYCSIYAIGYTDDIDHDSSVIMSGIIATETMFGLKTNWRNASNGNTRARLKFSFYRTIRVQKIH